MNYFKDEIMENITVAVVELTDSPFHVRYASDNSGNHIEISIENKKDSEIISKVTEKFHKRVIVRTCPPGYIKLFLDEE